MSSTHQLAAHLRRPRDMLQRVLPFLLVVAGVVLVGHALYLGLHRPGFLGGVPFGQVLPGFQFLLGVAVAAAGVLDRRGNTTPVLATLFALGVLVALTGPEAPLSLGLVQWTVLAGVVLVCVGLPAMVLVAVDRLELRSSPSTA